MSVRCDDHVGEPFPPRCSACDEAQADLVATVGALLDARAAVTETNTEGGR
jgi:hypothetical protein